MPGVTRRPNRETRTLMFSILLVEDNSDLAYGLKLNFEQEGYNVTTVHSGSDALQHLGELTVDLVILDVMLPDMSGLEVLRTIRTSAGSPSVIVLSARADEHIRVTAFRLGADDFVAKPFSLLELSERTKVHLRHAGLSREFPRILRIDISRRLVAVNGAAVGLTAKEFDLLCELVAAEGRVVSKKHLLQSVWKHPPNVLTRTVETHITSLRKALEMAGLACAIRTVHGKGYAWGLRREDVDLD
jgi:two-component system, OmpR family, response regulator